MTRAPGLPLRDVEQAEAELGWSLPADLRDLYLATDGLRDDDARLQVVWPLEELVAMSRSQWCADLAAEDLVAFGSDGAGTSFCLRRDGSPTVLGWYPVDGEARAVAASLADFWTAWTTGSGVRT